MTPTEQDKELREKISHRFDSVCAEGHQQSCGEYQTAVDDVMQLITADRKRVALGARIDSLLAAKRRIYETDAFELGLALGIIDSELKKLGWTPSELKAQQEEV